MNYSTPEELLKLDAAHVWHPYSSIGSDSPVYPVVSADGVYLHLADGRHLIDGMSSWWSAIHGYNHPTLVEAIKRQAEQLPHVMFGGLTHPPAVALASKLVELTPPALQQVFFSDSGSVSVEVAIKMAMQYWQAKGEPDKHQLLTVRSGYHGDTFGAMSVCDPVTGMHHLFNQTLAKHRFAPAPACTFDAPWQEHYIAELTAMLERHAENIAAVILEPIVQGAGGMRFYSPSYLKRLRELCDEHSVLLILDEIATGFGRTGKLFACEHADIAADIMCLGKALTGGYMSFAATLTTEEISHTISAAPPHAFMHGPTFMGNPLACATALASIQLLEENDWQSQVSAIEAQLRQALAPARELAHIQDVRILGAIGVVESKRPVNMKAITESFVDKGIWVRPFGKLIYIMPPFVISAGQLSELCSKLVAVICDEQLFL